MTFDELVRLTTGTPARVRPFPIPPKPGRK